MDTCEDVVKDELGDEKFVAAHFTRDAALQLDSFIVVDVVHLPQNLNVKLDI